VAKSKKQFLTRVSFHENRGPIEWLDHAVMKSVAEQLIGGRKLWWEGGSSGLRGRDRGAFRTVWFVAGGEEYQAIEQNPEKPSRWGQLARQGHRVVQFRDLQTQKYVAAVVDGEVHAYGKK
jgi:hypothetical protein